MKLKRLTKRKAVIFLIILALVLSAAVFLCGPKIGFFDSAEAVDASKATGRIEYLLSFGWEVDAESEECETITLPESFDGVLSDYAAMQSEQGFDFSSCCGCECERYSYIVTNYPDDGTVYAVLFVKGKSIIGGDIHSAEIGGFMHGIK